VSSALAPQSLLRPGLLDGARIAIAGPAGASGEDGGSQAEALAIFCEQLGARIGRWELPGEGDPEAREAATLAALEPVLAELGGLETLIVDTAALFAAEGARQSLIGSMESCWSAVRVAANRVFLADGAGGGRIILVGPPPAAGEHATAATAGLENLARTLSIEWARHAATTVAIAPGDQTSQEDLATVAAYLASPAGAYFSGCLLDLRGPTS
jgi:NAD(P)-dependent dehydrogenase (short-subunit alcohol dehydrogenase family)